MTKKFLLVSLNFAPGHIAHLKAFYQLIEDIGYQAAMYLDDKYLKYLPSERFIIFTNKNEIEKYKPDFALIQNVSPKNISFCNTTGGNT